MYVHLHTLCLLHHALHIHAAAHSHRITTSFCHYIILLNQLSHADPKTEKDRQTYIKNSRKTVEKPNSPLSGYLTNTNEENGFDNPAEGRKDPDGTETEYPYIHFTEAEKLRSLPNGVVLSKEEAVEEAKEEATLEKKVVEEAAPAEEAEDTTEQTSDEIIDSVISENEATPED